jgi:hypothetical protein
MFGGMPDLSNACSIVVVNACRSVDRDITTGERRRVWTRSLCEQLSQSHPTSECLGSKNLAFSFPILPTAWPSDSLALGPPPPPHVPHAVNGLSAQPELATTEIPTAAVPRHVTHFGELLSRVARLAAKVGTQNSFSVPVAGTQSCCHVHPRLHKAMA